MVPIRLFALQAALLLLLPFSSFAGTGILEVRSAPSGAHVWIDGRDAGVTPYQNFEAPAGKHLVKAMLNPAYPPQVQEVAIDERIPQVIMFKFMERSKGEFTGREIVHTAYKYRGDVTFASIPTGAHVIINGEPLLKSTPVGYADVEVGRYTVEFRLEGRTLRAEFDVMQGEPTRLIADFNSGKVINPREEAKVRQETAKREEASAKREEKQIPKAAVVIPAPEPLVTPVSKSAQAIPAAAPPAVPVSTRPQPVEGAQPFGELIIMVNAGRDGNLSYSDYFDVALPRLPVESLSGPLFPSATTDMSAFKDNFEYKNDSDAETRQVIARVHFGEQDSGPASRFAKSSIMTVQEGTYDLKIARLRLVNHFTSAQKLFDASGMETIEIIRGNRLIVRIDSHIDADNKLRYEISKIYEQPGKKTQPGGGQHAPTTAAVSSGLPIFSSIQN